MSTKPAVDLSASNSLTDLAARIREVAGVTADESRKRYRFAIRNAAQTCSNCAKCGRALTADAPVWRAQLPLGYGPFGRWQTKIAPVCEQCASKWRARPARPCENCQRPVHQENNFRSHRRTFCCEVCEHAARASFARQKRTDVRGTRQCESCGETFEPTRTDARFCSPACRQRTYRRRKAVTDDESLSASTFVSRNADAKVRS
jgi:hypothetical protein